MIFVVVNNLEVWGEIFKFFLFCLKFILLVDIFLFNF